MTTTWSKRTKPTTGWDGRIDYLLNEDETYLLWEDGTKIVISQKYTENPNWTERSAI